MRLTLLLLTSSCTIGVNAGSNPCVEPNNCDALTTVADAGVAESADAGLPAVMILLDTSGSLNAPVNPSNPDCRFCAGSSCGPTCPTYVDLLKGGLSQFLQAQPGVAWLGLTTFPDSSNATFMPSGCAPATREAVPLAPIAGDAQTTVVAQSQAVLSHVQGLGVRTPVVGGTPTAASLRYLATLPAMRSSRRTGVILVTDGIPNCNPNNVLSCNASPLPGTELCTLGNSCVGMYCSAGYLDVDETVLAIRALKNLDIKVAIIGVGPGTGLSGVPGSEARWNAMADEGGATACQPGQQCARRFFEADNAAQLYGSLATALRRVMQ